MFGFEESSLITIYDIIYFLMPPLPIQKTLHNTKYCTKVVFEERKSSPEIIRLVSPSKSAVHVRECKGMH
jgi:hypothetical protein